MRTLFLLGLAVLTGVAQAALPQQMRLTYDLYRNGHKLGQVTDTFTRSGSRYTLVSETRATGPLKALWPGVIRLQSSGTLTAQGLRPMQFEHARSDAPHKRATAELDWARHSITFSYKGQRWSLDGLQEGAQDQLSQLYQFMAVAELPAAFALQVVSGRDLHDYRYVGSEGGVVATPLGALATRQYQRVGQKPEEKAITLWIAPARDNLPVQVRVVEDGVVLEQRLVHARVGA